MLPELMKKFGYPRVPRWIFEKGEFLPKNGKMRGNLENKQKLNRTSLLNKHKHQTTYLSELFIFLAIPSTVCK
jgi:hypothetical protein